MLQSHEALCYQIKDGQEAYALLILFVVQSPEDAGPGFLLEMSGV